MFCLNCGYENKAGALTCEGCGRMLVAGISTRKLEPSEDPTPVPTWQMPPALEPNEVLIEVSATGKFVRRALPDAGLVIGRRDTVSGFKPDVDLSEFLSIQWDVSRRHCWIGRKLGIFTIRDLASTNGVYIDGKRLAANVDIPLGSGANVRLGLIILRVFIGKMP